MGKSTAVSKLLLGLVRDFYGTSGWKAVVCVALSVCIGLAEGGGLLTLVPLVEVVSNGTPLPTTGLSLSIRQFLDGIGITLSLGSILLCGAAFALLRAALTYWLFVLRFLLGRDFVLGLQERLYMTLIRADWMLLQRQQKAGLGRALTVETERSGSAAQLMVDLLSSAILTLVYFLLGLAVSLPLVLLIAALGVGMTFALRNLYRRSRIAGEGLVRSGAELQHNVEEHLRGVKLARCLDVEERHLEHFLTSAIVIRGHFLQAIRGQAAINFFFRALTVVGMALAIFFAVGTFSLPAGEIALLGALAMRLTGRLAALHANFQTLWHLIPSWSKVVEHQVALSNPYREVGGDTPVEFQREICFDRVSFGYDREPVLKDIQLRFHKGEIVGLTGASGSGKTTLADLLIGLLRPESGQLLIDGRPLSEESHYAWRRKIGYVGQECHLFDETVRENLLYALPDATDEQIWNALYQAEAEDFVRKLPLGLDTVVGTAGCQFSGGEKQRIAIARALLRQPELLVLDEITSHLDVGHATRIADSVSRLRGEATVLIVSHQPQMLRIADNVYHLEDGKVEVVGERGQK